MPDARKQSFPPVAGGGAEILILGSLPGDESLRRGEYYAHKRNAFWPIMGAIFDFDPGAPYPERLERLIRNRIALWDVAGSGYRPGSLDAAIRDAAPNDIPGLLRAYPSIGRICCNGSAAFELLKRHFPELGVEVVRLISSSPAAAMASFDAKLTQYRNAIMGTRL